MGRGVTLRHPVHAPVERAPRIFSGQCPLVLGVRPFGQKRRIDNDGGIPRVGIQPQLSARLTEKPKKS